MAFRSRDVWPTMPEPRVERRSEPADRMRILFVNKFHFPKGGAETVLFDEIALMGEAGAEVAVLSMRDPRNRPSPYENYFVSHRDYRSGSPALRARSALSMVHSSEAVASITRLLDDFRPDIVHCHNIYHQITPSILKVAGRRGIPTVLTLHDYKLVCPVYTRLRGSEPCTDCAGGGFEAVLRHRCAGGSLLQSSLLWAEARYHAAARSYDWVDRFVAPSRFMRDAVSARVDTSRVVHIPNPIAADRIDEADEGDDSVLFFGRLSPEKGVETLLSAHAADPGWRLVVAGTGPLQDSFRARFPRAAFTGHLDQEALRRTIRAASVVVVPSEWHENAPMSIIEAMAHGKPVVASRIGGNPEMVRHGVNGLLFEPKDARGLSRCIKALLADPGLRTRLGREGRRIAREEYSAERHRASLLALYGSLIADRGRGSAPA
mgnify:CR=1 FL=1